MKEKSVSESHSTLPNVILTVGVKAIHGKFPVVPPTQFVQLSRKAVPFGVLLQSTGKLIVVKFCSTDHPEDGKFPSLGSKLTPLSQGGGTVFLKIISGI